MAKKFGKVLMMTAALGAVAGGIYYYLKGQDALMDDDFDDDDFDNFDDDLDEADTDRNYVDLDLNKAEDSAKEELKEDFKEGIQAAKAEAADKVVGSVKKVEEFFDDDDSDGSMDAI